MKRGERGREREREVRGIRNIYKHDYAELDADTSGKNSEYQQNKLFCVKERNETIYTDFSSQ